jgi:hypothetical protein
LKIAREVEPIPEEIIMVMIMHAIWQGELWVALSLACQFDMLWREQDIEQVRTSDVHEAGGQISFTLGDPERGEEVKTGVDQGTVVDNEWVKVMIRVAVQLLPFDALMFQFPIPYLRKVYSHLRVSVGKEASGKVHEVRHSATANQFRRKKRDKDGVRDRGRWATDRSLRVYHKPHLLIRALATYDPSLIIFGNWLIENADLVAAHWVERVREAALRQPFAFSRVRARVASFEERRLLSYDGSASPSARPGEAST